MEFIAAGTSRWRLRHQAKEIAGPARDSTKHTSVSLTTRFSTLPEFSLPDGKKVVVSLPEDLDALRRKYSNSDELQTELVIHGSAEHANYLRQSREHHERRKEALRHRHGPAFDEWENVNEQLNSVTAELDRLSNQASGLGGNFGKFGFDADLRTYDSEHTDGPGSSTASISDQGEPRPAETIKLFKKPVVKQWFHRGLLWRASEQTEVMAIELFFDLLYVGIIHTNGEHMTEEPNGYELLRFSVTFIMSWKIWTDITLTLSWFESDDVFTRLEILFMIACLLAFTTNMINSFSEDPSTNTYVQLVSYYLAARLFAAVHYAITAFTLPMIKGVMICSVLNILVPAALWIGSIHVEMPGRLGLIWPALALDLFAQGLSIGLFRWARSVGQNTSLGTRLNRFFEFYPAMNIEHRVERMNAFVSLVLGYSVVSILFQSGGGYSVNAFLGKAVLGLIQAFIFNWIYFDVDARNLNLHAIRRSANTAILWQFAHLPFVMGYIVATSGLSTLVLASDVANANPEQLAEPYSSHSEDHFGNAVRFFYCQGLAIALLSMTAISLSHDHRTPATLRWAKRYRLVNRVAVCIVMFLLPLAHSLDSLELIGTTLGLSAWVLIVELFGKSCKDDPFIGEKKGCGVRYLAKCSKKDMEKAGLSGLEDTGRRSADVVELGRQDKTAVHGQAAAVAGSAAARALGPQLLVPHQLRDAPPLLLGLAAGESHGGDEIQHEEAVRARGLALSAPGVPPLEGAEMGAHVLGARVAAAVVHLVDLVAGDVAAQLDARRAVGPEAVRGAAQDALVGGLVAGADKHAVAGAAGRAQ
ncbi:low temperature requirement A protein(LtrA) [Purpureocillium lavendulum]|uniref:Low temperature requirement A protein(LtrA) n=1 Tax=Purpureocillium lavendulum TaxID=1247861 RepID=A0AB34FUG0_9HYPO|nr:low temperature requirement A protein(LtrA) [Purpureocillium lavendulum]